MTPHETKEISIVRQFYYLYREIENCEKAIIELELKLNNGDEIYLMTPGYNISLFFGKSFDFTNIRLDFIVEMLKKHCNLQKEKKEHVFDLVAFTCYHFRMDTKDHYDIDVCNFFKNVVTPMLDERDRKNIERLVRDREDYLRSKSLTPEQP